MKRKLFLISSLVLLSASCRGQVEGIDNNPIDTSYGNSQILIAYFSYSGNTQAVANMINEEIDADIFRIVPAKAYTNADVFDRAQSELKNKEYPELSAHIDKELFAKYDTIILGYPIWWYDLPMPVWSFSSEYDFTGKTVIPFYTHNGSSSGASSLSTLTNLLPNSDVKSSSALSIRGSNASNAKDDVVKWLNQLGL